MNHPIIYQMYYAFVDRGFSALRFNFRGVGRSQGNFDHGIGELSDAAAALDWAQTINPEAKSCWIAGFSFGAWIGMQLLMRRPEIEGFISICPPANLYDFSFLAPCPSSGLIIHGDKDAVVPAKDINTLVEKLKTQKGIVIEQKVVAGANHFFDGKVEPLLTSIGAYLDKRLKTRAQAERGVSLPPLSLDHLTVIDATPIELIDAAAAGGFDAVGLRIITPLAAKKVFPVIGRAGRPARAQDAHVRQPGSRSALSNPSGSARTPIPMRLRPPWQLVPSSAPTLRSSPAMTRTRPGSSTILATWRASPRRTA